MVAAFQTGRIKMERRSLLVGLIAVGVSACGISSGEPTEVEMSGLSGNGLDPTFGSGGIVQTQFGNNVNNFGFVDSALQSNGDVLVLGTVSFINGTSQSGVLVRYLPSGALDPSFGTAGQVILSLGTSQTAPLTMSLQSDGKILVLAVFVNGVAPAQVNLVRLTSSGAFDPTFGSSGRVVVTFPAPAPLSASPNLVLAQPDGKILLAGSATPPRHNTTPPQTVLGRYLANGAVDTTFGSGGFASAVAVSTPLAVALLSDGGEVVVRWAPVPSQVAVAQFSGAGALLPAPTGASVVASKQAGAGQGTIAFQPNGQFILAQPVAVSKVITNVRVTRYSPQGAVDPTFQTAQFSYGDVLTKSSAQAITVDSLGRVVVGGGYQPTTTGTSLFGIARLTSTGSLDATFGNGGVLTTSVALGGSSWSTLAQPNGEIISSGVVQVAKDTSVTETALAVLRYLSGS
jgi:uncharacterized delta-60 repeat protein